MEWRGSKGVIVFLLLLAFYPMKSVGQDTQDQSVDSLWWKQKTEQLDYTEDQVEKKNREFDAPDLSWINLPIFKYSILALITIGLLVLLFYLFRNDFFSSDHEDSDKEYSLLFEKNLDDRFYEMNLDLLLKNAINEGQWKLAIRIRFLQLLRSLIDDKRINWHKDLTNLQIVYQLSDQLERKKFSEIVYDFERVWYGDQMGTNEHFMIFDQSVISFSSNSKKESIE